MKIVDANETPFTSRTETMRLYDEIAKVLKTSEDNDVLELDPLDIRKLPKSKVSSLKQACLSRGVEVAVDISEEPNRILIKKIQLVEE